MFNKNIKFRCENINKEYLPMCNDDWDYCEKKYIVYLIILYFLQYRNRHTRMNSQGNKFIIHWILAMIYNYHFFYKIIFMCIFFHGSSVFEVIQKYFFL